VRNDAGTGKSLGFDAQSRERFRDRHLWRRSELYRPGTGRRPPVTAPGALSASRRLDARSGPCPRRWKLAPLPGATQPNSGTPFGFPWEAAFTFTGIPTQVDVASRANSGDL
jgi:hypothetical protein